jgi:hypothetical protein
MKAGTMAEARRTDSPTRYARARRAAQRQGLRLVSSRRRDPRALDFGRYWLVSLSIPVVPMMHTTLNPAESMTLEQVEARLAGDR